MLKAFFEAEIASKDAFSFCEIFCNKNLDRAYIEVKRWTNMQEKTIFHILPLNIRKLIREEHIDLGRLQEIRLRVEKPLLLMYEGVERIPRYSDNKTHIVSKEEINTVMEYVSNYSLYAFEEEMRQGFITVDGGHRVGITGQVIVEHGSVRNIRYISSLNIRISHEIPGCSDSVFPFITDSQGMLHTLLISPPGCGKTTMMRDIIRQVSDGNEYINGMTVGVVDERSEIAGCYCCIPQNDMGIRTDVLDCCPKAEGMIMMIRSMRPDVLAVDEIGEPEDVQAVSYAMHCGVKMLATAHGESMEELKRKPVFSEMIREERFERYVFLKNRGQIDKVYDSGGSVIECCLKY